MEPLDYYTWLASNFSTSGIARSMAKRLAWRSTLYGHGGQEPFGDPRPFLEFFCASDPLDLALKLSAPRASRLWADASKREEIATLARRMPAVTERVRERAEGAWARAKWAQERMGQLVALAQGVWLTADEGAKARYAKKVVEKVVDFALRNQVDVGLHGQSASEAALRCTNLALAFLMLRHRPELQRGDFALALASQLLAHGNYIEAALDESRLEPGSPHVAQLVGLLHLGTIFPELPRARAWRDRALEQLRLEIVRMVLADGFTAEGSASAHRLAIELFLLGREAALARGESMGEDYDSRLHAMFGAVRAYVTRGGRAPRFGESDAGRALPLAPRGALEHGYLLAIGAALFGDAELRAEGAAYPEEALFLLGRAGAERYARLGANVLWPSAALRNGGLYTLRAGAIQATITCGPVGLVELREHLHNDKLALELHAGEVAVLVDSGTQCRPAGIPGVALYGSTRAHSTIQIDGEEQQLSGERRAPGELTTLRCRAIHFDSSPARERFVGEHRGFERLSSPVRHRREVTLERRSMLVRITDRLSGEGSHRIASRFQLPDLLARPFQLGGAARRVLEEAGLQERLAFDQALELGPEGASRALFIPPRGVALRLVPFDYSPGYAERRPALMIELTANAQLPIEWNTVLLLYGEWG